MVAFGTDMNAGKAGRFLQRAAIFGSVNWKKMRDVIQGFVDNSEH
jgi:hypothetical protein